jgi:hypothetical protein
MRSRSELAFLFAHTLSDGGRFTQYEATDLEKRVGQTKSIQTEESGHLGRVPTSVSLAKSQAG